MGQYPVGVAIGNLDRQQGFALIAEMTSTRNLLAYGIRVLRAGAFIETTRDPIMTMLSIGVEKLYKLTLGLASLDHDHKWPSAAEMKAWGHRLVAMHEAVLTELRSRTVDKSLRVWSLSLRSRPTLWCRPLSKPSIRTGGWDGFTIWINSAVAPNRG
jgi:hypothetical protein